jgi:hypothetical protein
MKYSHNTMPVSLITAGMDIMIGARWFPVGYVSVDRDGKPLIYIGESSHPISLPNPLYKVRWTKNA